jgi:glycerophosphoryl diester phosphodiesterase
MSNASGPASDHAARPLVLAHRGDWLEAETPWPQNSVGAVLSALAAGADGAEVDARLNAQGTVVLHHDPEIGPADLQAGCLAPLGTPICDLADADLGHLSTLPELLARLASGTSTVLGGHTGAVLLNIEMKDLPGEPGWDAVLPLARTVADLLGRHLASNRVDVLVSSFDVAAIAWFARNGPGTASALLVDEGDDWRQMLGQVPGIGALNPAEGLARPDLFAAAAQEDLAVFPWTVDSPARAIELAGHGATGLITNRPRALLAALRA